MQQYFIETLLDEQIEFNKEQSHHIQHVMRMKEGSVVKAVDPHEQAALVRIHYEKDRVVGLMQEMLTKEERKIQMLLAMGLIKKEKWELCIQKSCECGAYAIYPFVSSRSVVKISDEKNEKKAARWQKIASEACEQSKQEHCCQVMPLGSFEQILNLQADLKCIAYENATGLAANLAGLLSSHPQASKILVVIGPEGGFSEEEVLKAIEHGFVCISLGKRILRAETAAVCALNMISYHYELLEEWYGTQKNSEKG